MNPSAGLITALNSIRQVIPEIYHQHIPVVNATTNINDYATPILSNKQLFNEFVPALITRIVETKIVAKRYTNPLKMLEGNNMPLGQAGQEININPVNGRKFNVNDFAGLLQKYEAQVNVQYYNINMDLQYPITMTRDKIRNAFVSWEALQNFVDGYADALYNAARIDEYRYTTAIVSSAYKSGIGNTEVITAPTDADKARAFVKRARRLFLDFKAPTTDYTSWQRMDAEGRSIITWTEPESIVFILRNDIASEIDVEVLANAFNIDKTTLMGNIITVDNFNIYDSEDRSKVVYDGSKILGIMADKAWFKIKTQDEAFDEFYNANARCWNMYLNLVKMYNFSLFAKHVIFATEAPEVPVESVKFKDDTASVSVGMSTSNLVVPTPTYATSEIAFTSSDNTVATVASDESDPRRAVVTGVSAGTATITATANSKTATFTVTVSEVPVTSMSFASATKTVGEGSTVNNKVTVSPDNATTSIVFSSSDNTVATVEADSTDTKTAVVTGVSAGTATITATAGSVSATFTITVE